MKVWVLPEPGFFRVLSRALLQEIEAQHPLDPDRRPAIARFGVERLDQLAERRPQNYALHLSQKRRPLLGFGIPSVLAIGGLLLGAKVLRRKR